MLCILVGCRFLIKNNHIVAHCCGICYIIGTILTRLNQCRHVVTDAVKDNLKLSLKVSLLMDLCENVIIFQLLTEPSIGHYAKFMTIWYRGCWYGDKPWIQGLSSIDVNFTHAEGIQRIAHVPCPSSVSNNIW